MNRTITILGLAALCAVALGAVAAPGAQAENTTAFTCVEGGGGLDFADAHCTEDVGEGNGEYGHVAIPAGEDTELTLSAVGEQRFTAIVAGAYVETAAEGLECVGCSLENVEEGEGMKVVGPAEGTEAGHLEYTNVVVAGSLGERCTVVSDPGEEPHVVTTEPLQFETTGTNSVVIAPASGEVLARFKIVTNPNEHGKKCPLIGTYNLQGSVTATTEGATVRVEEELGDLFLNGSFPAAFDGEVTIEAGTEGERHHPLAVGDGEEVEPTTQVGTTAFTCTKGGGAEDFADAHCDESVGGGSGEYGHVSIKTGEPKEIELTNAATKGETGEATPTTINASVAGAEATITAGAVSGAGTIENYEPKADVHAVRGEATLSYSELEVEAPSGCSIAGPLEATTTFEAVEEGEAMGIEFAPKSGSTFFDLTFEGEECELADITAHVTGTVTATGGAGGTAKGSGATAVLEAAHESLGVGKGEASIASTMTMRLKEGNPLALTTVE
ncbi:MAG: hypothetical protein WCD85_18685 [Pantoea agglomerans]